MYFVVTVICAPPFSPGFDLVVTTESTYFVPEPEETSQPQALASMIEPEAADWMVSVMLVLHVEPAKMASDIFARAV